MSSSDDDDDNSNNGGEFEVETILKHRRSKGRLLFRVKWKGYSLKECTWEPEENLGNCTQLLETYKRLNLRRGRKRPVRTPPSSSSDDDEEDAEKEEQEESTKENSPQDAKPGRQSRVSSSDSSSSMYRGPPSITPVLISDTTSEEPMVISSDDDATLPDLSSEEPTTDLDSSISSLQSFESSSPQIEHTGYDRGWEAKKVLGVTRYPDNTLWVLMAWRGHEAELIPNYVANEKSPDLVIAYYEKHLQWKAYGTGTKK